MAKREHFGTRLAALREARGLTVYALAKAAGIERSCVSRYEAGTHHPSWDAACSLAVALGASLSEFETNDMRKKILENSVAKC